MTIHDPCGVRGQNNIYNSVRKLLQRMNIVITEAEKMREKSVCCSVSGRELDFDIDDVVVYCTSCMFRLRKAGKRTHHMIDLIFNEKSNQEMMSLRS
jgi:Fe-S oxidoreductase